MLLVWLDKHIGEFAGSHSKLIDWLLLTFREIQMRLEDISKDLRHWIWLGTGGFHVGDTVFRSSSPSQLLFEEPYPMPSG